MWLASVSISCASYASSNAPWRQMQHTRWFGLWSTLESTTVMDFLLLVRSTCSRSKSLFFALPPDLFCSSRIVRPFLTLCDGSCTGSRWQIESGSNCVRWYTDACTDSLLTICPISAHPPRCTLSWDHLRHLNDRCLSPGRNQNVRSARILLCLVRCLERTPSASAWPWSFVEQF